jgi:hypothetical protein
MKQWEVECAECGAKNSFSDTHDISHAHWTILAWKLPEGDPLVVCDKCEYGKPKKKEKK